MILGTSGTFSALMRERRSLPISSEVALKSDKDGTGKLVVNSVICGVVDELSNGRTGRRGSWVRHAVMGVLRWKDLTGVRTSTPTDQKEVSQLFQFLLLNFLFLFASNSFTCQ